MTYPTQSQIELPLLQVIAELGGEARPKDTYPRVATHFPELTPEELSRRTESKPSVKKWNNMVQWTRQGLIDKGEIDGSIRGLWKITPLGESRLKDSGAAFSSPNFPSSHLSIQTKQSDITLRDIINDDRERMKRRVLTELKSLSPVAFEKFCALLLQELGYANLEVTSRSADGGIDGFGDFQQGVVEIRSAFQAKRWKDSPVGRPEIDKFRGAIQGDYDHGVFLTTSRFTSDAQEASVKKGAITILLLDGDSLAELMIDRGVGVQKQPIYLLDIDDEFFVFEDAG